MIVMLSIYSDFYLNCKKVSVEFNGRFNKAELTDLQEILNLQYLAYQSEAKLLNNPDIPPCGKRWTRSNENFVTE